MVSGILNLAVLLIVVGNLSLALKMAGGNQGRHAEETRREKESRKRKQYKLKHAYVTRCPSCRTETAQTNPEMVGRWLSCPRCGESFQIKKIRPAYSKREIQRAMGRFTAPNGRVKGVCAGIADAIGINRTLVRCIFAVVTVATYVLPGLLVYVLLVFVGPKPRSKLPKPRLRR